MVKVKTGRELRDLIDETISKEGYKCDLNFIDTSLITDMSELFQDSKFNGDISEWNTGNVENMDNMFDNSTFNQNINSWNVDSVKNFWEFNIGNSISEDNLPLAFRNPLVQSKSYIGWEKLRYDWICKLLISEDAIKLRGGGNVCRTNKAKVLEIRDYNNKNVSSGYSIFNGSFTYEVGKDIVLYEFDPDRWNECSSGIHFFLTKEEAEKYY